MKTTRTSPAPCPTCDKIIDAASSFEGDIQPEPGDITICFGCQDILVFTQELGLRHPTTEELAELADGALLQVSQIQGALTRAKARR